MRGRWRAANSLPLSHESRPPGRLCRVLRVARCRRRRCAESVCIEHRYRMWFKIGEEAVKTVLALEDLGHHRALAPLPLRSFSAATSGTGSASGSRSGMTSCPQAAETVRHRTGHSKTLQKHSLG